MKKPKSKYNYENSFVEWKAKEYVWMLNFKCNLINVELRKAEEYFVKIIKRFDLDLSNI